MLEDNQTPEPIVNTSQPHNVGQPVQPSPSPAANLPTSPPGSNGSGAFRQSLLGKLIRVSLVGLGVTVLIIMPSMYLLQFIGISGLSYAHPIYVAAILIFGSATSILVGFLLKLFKMERPFFVGVLATSSVFVSYLLSIFVIFGYVGYVGSVGDLGFLREWPAIIPIASLFFVFYLVSQNKARSKFIKLFTVVCTYAVVVGAMVFLTTTSGDSRRKYEADSKNRAENEQNDEDFAKLTFTPYVPDKLQASKNYMITAIDPIIYSAGLNSIIVKFETNAEDILADIKIEEFAKSEAFSFDKNCMTIPQKEGASNKKYCLPYAKTTDGKQIYGQAHGYQVDSEYNNPKDTPDSFLADFDGTIVSMSIEYSAEDNVSQADIIEIFSSMKKSNPEEIVRLRSDKRKRDREAASAVLKDIDFSPYAPADKFYEEKGYEGRSFLLNYRDGVEFVYGIERYSKTIVKSGYSIASYPAVDNSDNCATNPGSDGTVKQCQLDFTTSNGRQVYYDVDGRSSLEWWFIKIGNTQVSIQSHDHSKDNISKIVSSLQAIPADQMKLYQYNYRPIH